MTGSGTQEDPYIIYDVDDLQAMENDLAAYYELANDIDASATSGWNAGAGFDPVGIAADKFTGQLDGKGYTISDLFINRPVVAAVGLFGYANGITVQNITLTTVDITGGSVSLPSEGVGALVGIAYPSGTLCSNCHSSGSVAGINASTGGLLGQWDDGIIEDSSSSCSVSGISYAGGLIGYSDSATIRRCYATGDVDMDDWSGGFIGYNSGGTISKCFATGDVSGAMDSDGDVVGGFAGYSDGTIADCYARGAVSCYQEVGGFIGESYPGGVLDNCYSTGLVTYVNELLVGGFSGGDWGTTTDCFWDTETSGMATSASGTGKTTAEMKTASTFTDAGWDFTTIWQICGGVNAGYPCLLDITPNCVAVVLVGGLNPALLLLVLE